MSGGQARRFFVHVPPNYTGQPLGVVVGLHGLFESPAEFRGYANYDDIGDVRGFISVYPEGLNQSWNGGTCCSTSTPNDVGFIRDVVAAVQREWCVDPLRIHASGFSNGGIMTHRLACEMADVFASVGAGSGPLMSTPCSPARPIPLVHYHGTADTTVPYNGGSVVLVTFPSVANTMAGWAARNGCASTPTRLWEDAGVQADAWACDGGADVVLYTLQGGDHLWTPSGVAWIDGGTPNARLGTSRAFIEFFERHPKR